MVCGRSLDEDGLGLRDGAACSWGVFFLSWCDSPSPVLIESNLGRSCYLRRDSRNSCTIMVMMIFSCLSRSLWVCSNGRCLSRAQVAL